MASEAKGRASHELVLGATRGFSGLSTTVPTEQVSLENSPMTHPPNRVNCLECLADVSGT